jgi:hypothetical protein
VAEARQQIIGGRADVKAVEIVRVAETVKYNGTPEGSEDEPSVEERKKESITLASFKVGVLNRGIISCTGEHDAEKPGTRVVDCP